jgi:DHA2 family multidrug resistance protein
MQPSNPAYVHHLGALTQAYGAVASGPGAAALARGSIYRELNRQAAGQGYLDIYRLLAWLAVGMFACALLLSKHKPGQGAPAGEAG